jgi:hypothetical protein
MRPLQRFKHLDTVEAECAPLKLSRSCVQACRTISTASRKRSALCSTVTPKALNSAGAKPRPAPQLTRPPDSMSSSATSSASLSG